MIARLRKRHARMAAALAVAAPCVFVAALTSRVAPVELPNLPPALGQAVSHFVPAGALPVFESALLWPGHRLHTRVLLSGKHQILELTAAEPLRAPDVLLYASNAGVTDAALPAGAQLLGRFAGSRPQHFALGERVPASLWLYSLAHGEVIARADLAGAQR